MKRILVALLCFSMLFGFAGCAKSNNTTSQQTYKTTYTPKTENTVQETEKVNKEKYDAMNVGNIVTSNDWNIKLTNAYTSTNLESSESSTYWTADNGYAFLILEFDITCLNSNKPAIVGGAFSELVATAGKNTYTGWKYRYINSQIWCYIREYDYLGANLPLHVYVHTMIPEASMHNAVSVNLKIAGQPKVITIN